MREMDRAAHCEEALPIHTILPGHSLGMVQLIAVSLVDVCNAARLVAQLLIILFLTLVWHLSGAPCVELPEAFLRKPRPSSFVKTLPYRRMHHVREQLSNHAGA